VILFRGDGLGRRRRRQPTLSVTGQHNPGSRSLRPLLGEDGPVAPSFLRQAREVLKTSIRQLPHELGFATFPSSATIEEVYGVKPVAIAVYPMSSGLAAPWG